MWDLEWIVRVILRVKRNVELLCEHVGVSGVEFVLTFLCHDGRTKADDRAQSHRHLGGLNG